MVKKLFFIFNLFVIVLTLSACDGGGPDVSKKDLSWGYVKSPSGKYYEVSTFSLVGGYSYAVSGQIDNPENYEGLKLSFLDDDLAWSYTKSLSERCYEVGTYSSIGGYSYAVSGQVDISLCQ